MERVVSQSVLNIATMANVWNPMFVNVSLAMVDLHAPNVSLRWIFQFPIMEIDSVCLLRSPLWAPGLVATAKKLSKMLFESHTKKTNPMLLVEYFHQTCMRSFHVVLAKVKVGQFYRTDLVFSRALLHATPSWLQLGRPCKTPTFVRANKFVMLG